MVAPDGYRIPNGASFNVNIVYGEPPSENGFPILYIAIGVIGAIVLIGAAVIVFRKRL